MTAKKKNTNKAAAPASKVRGPATADAILGGAPARGGKTPPVKIKPEWVKYYNRLLELREQLLKQRDGLAKESAQQLPSYSLHMADTGTDNFDRDFALSLLSSDQDALYEIDAALKRIEKNTYGICELTGKPIPKARLDAIPWARYTVEAQAQLERSGMAKQRRLASLGALDIVAPTEPDNNEEEGDERLRDKE